MILLNIKVYNFFESIDIGPFCDAAGITTDNFTANDDSSLLRLDVLKSGLVLELQWYLTKKQSFSPMRLVDILIQITQSNVDCKTAQVYVKRLVERQKHLRRTKQAAKTQEKLNLLNEEIFQMKRKRSLKDPDTPRKKRLRQELSSKKQKPRKW